MFERDLALAQHAAIDIDIVDRTVQRHLIACRAVDITDAQAVRTAHGVKEA